jgi:hypothetical protein
MSKEPLTPHAVAAACRIAGLYDAAAQVVRLAEEHAALAGRVAGLEQALREAKCVGHDATAVRILAYLSDVSGKILAVAPESIVAADGPLRLTPCCDVSDLDIALPGMVGLALFEGWVEQGDGDLHFKGQWRALTFWETCRLRDGLLPWIEVGQ